LSRQLQELWNTGSSEYLRRLRASYPAGAAELAAVPGMTLRRIQLLHEALGISSVAELQGACAMGKVRSVKGFGQKTELALLAACARAAPSEPAQRELLLTEAQELGELLESTLRAVAPRATLAGTLRRGHELVRELDLVVPASELQPALRQLSTLRRVLRIDADQLSARLTDGVPLRLHSAPEDDFGGTLLAATGSSAHVARARALAAERGVQLRPFATEAELYRALGTAFVPPELREGGGELAQAASTDFSELVQCSDLQGAVHCHSTGSDGKNSVLELARAAQELGLRYITISDHSPQAHYARGLSLEGLQQQWREIEAAQRAVDIRILRGLEADILIDGQLDVPGELLARLDVVIASIHARHRLDRGQMTERLVRALSLPVFKIWGHPLGRILRHREPIDCDMPAVLDALAASRGAIEINADPHRLDLPPAWLPAARARNIPFVISVDAHSLRGLTVARHGVLMARRGGVRRQEVLNTCSADEFLRRVKPC
jgi:DNA polymerase (family 10)